MLIASLIGVVLIVLSQVIISPPLASLLFAAFGASILTLGTVSLVERRIILREFYRNYALLEDRLGTGIDRVYGAFSTSELQQLKKSLLDGAKKGIKLLGYTFPDYAFFADWKETLKRKAESGCKITILLVRPRCGMMAKRCDDETVDATRLYTIGMENSPEVLRSFLSLRDSVQDPYKNNLEVRLFDNYPTMNLQIYDNRMLVYYYGHKLRGTDSPLLLFTRTACPTSKYYETHYRNVYGSSVEADWGVLKEIEGTAVPV